MGVNNMPPMRSRRALAVLACLLAAPVALPAAVAAPATTGLLGSAPKAARRRRRAPSQAPKARASHRCLKPPKPPRLVVSPAAHGLQQGREPLSVRRLPDATAPRSPTPKSLSTSPRCRPVKPGGGGVASPAGSNSAREAEERALDEPAVGPFPAKIETLETEPAFRAQTTTSDPNAATVVYSTKVNFPSNGEWRIAALIKKDGELTSTLLPSAIVGAYAKIPRVGQKAPLIHTPTPADVGNDLSKITTRIPPDTQHEVDYADAFGKEPIVLLFATPQFCQSRVCGPVVDVAEQLKQLYGNKAAFIHMEIYNDNDPSKHVRPQVNAFHLPTEPWLFAIGRDGRIKDVIEGAFGVEELTRVVKGLTARMSEKTSPDAELLASFAEEAKRRCDVITAGLATETTDFETMRIEAHALRGAAGVVGLRRLAELAGLMESDLAEAKKTGTIRGGRTHQIADAAKAISEGAAAAAKGEEEPPDVGRSLAQLFSA